MPANRKPISITARRELLLLLLLVFAGLLFMPVAIYLVGGEIFGAYAGHGLGDFYRNIYGDLGDGQIVVLFLVLSPYLVWQLLRLTFHLFRRMAPPDKKRPENTPGARTGTRPL